MYSLPRKAFSSCALDLRTVLVRHMGDIAQDREGVEAG